MVARNFAKLMSYKDEYEVARLHADPAFRQQLKDAFEDGAKLRYNLAPPLFSKRDPQTGHLLKREFGPWMGKVFALLARRSEEHTYELKSLMSISHAAFC